jgi:ELWxxDGT repeat protein
VGKREFDRVEGEDVVAGAIRIGTHEVTGISGAYSGGLTPGGFTVFHGKVVFNGLDTAANSGLWVTDGTAAGTHELSVSGTYTGAGGLTPNDLTAVTLRGDIKGGLDPSGLTPARSMNLLVQYAAGFASVGHAGTGDFHLASDGHDSAPVTLIGISHHGGQA